MTMILKSKDAEEARAEKDIITWFVNNFGETDANTVCDWVWARERVPVKYVDALAHIAKKSSADRGFFESVLKYAQTQQATPEIRDAQAHLEAKFLPAIEHARNRIMGHRNDPELVKEALDDMRKKLEEEIRKMWPDKHRATVHGAIMCGTTATGIDFGAIARALINNKDPLGVNAWASWQ
jgi:hypothetical protein